MMVYYHLVKELQLDQKSIHGVLYPHAQFTCGKNVANADFVCTIIYPCRNLHKRKYEKKKNSLFLICDTNKKKRTGKVRRIKKKI